MQKIVPHLWFDTQALEAAKLYVSLFDNSKILSTDMLYDTPSGDAQTVRFQLSGLEFAAISAGPYFKFNSSISLMVACETKEEVEFLYHSLIQGGVQTYIRGICFQLFLTTYHFRDQIHLLIQNESYSLLTILQQNRNQQKSFCPKTIEICIYNKFP